MIPNDVTMNFYYFRLHVIKLGLVFSMWERLSSRDYTAATFEQHLFVTGKPVPREIDVKLMTLIVTFQDLFHFFYQLFFLSDGHRGGRCQAVTGVGETAEFVGGFGQ